MFTGTPSSMRPWGEHLAAEGFAVHCPLLPGHGTRWQDCNLTTEHDWTEAVSAAFDDLAKDVDRVVVAGLSMGGTLSIRLAEVRPDDVAALILVNPSLLTLRLDAKLLPLLAKVFPGWSPIGNDIKKPGVEEHGYDKTPLKPLHSMMRGWKAVRQDLHKVTCPLLVFRSAEDHVVDPSSARIILSQTSSSDARERVLENSYHVATLDNDAETVFAESAEFIERVVATGHGAPAAEPVGEASE